LSARERNRLKRMAKSLKRTSSVRSAIDDAVAADAKRAKTGSQAACSGAVGARFPTMHCGRARLWLGFRASIVAVALLKWVPTFVFWPSAALGVKTWSR
jgi:hypothetical protein